MKENDIRPRDLLKKYLELSEEDAAAYFSKSPRTDIDCPACVSGQGRHTFDKWGFGYELCDTCGSLYQSPRPPQDDFARFYRQSPSIRYWNTVFFPAVAETRRKSLFRPKVEEIAKLCAEDSFAPDMVVDVGAGYGLLLEEWRRRFPETRTVAVEPNPDQAAECRRKNIEVVECFAEEATGLQGQVDLAVALEVIEHVHDPLAFCRSLWNLLREGGRGLLTGLTVDGFDIQVLWDKAKSVSPPLHLNFLSVEGFKILLKRAGFSEVRIFTPGRLDVDIVRNTVAEQPDILKDQPFLHRLLSRDEKVLEAFQTFLRENRMSSHCWIWAKP